MLEARANLPFIGIAAYAGGVGVLMADCSSCGLPMMQLRGCQSRPLVRKIPVHGVGNDASTSGHLRPHQAATVIQAMSRGGEVVTTKDNGPQPQDGCEGAGAATGITGAIIVANAVDVADTAAGIAGVAELKVTIGTTTQAGGSPKHLRHCLAGLHRESSTIFFSVRSHPRIMKCFCALMHQ
mmetsp:Transcript_56635/g.89969  ORF Transcript_56635/g.89969 Transcript_56635/m.89969 type:complete len:182 (-) Transcript_56635:528-1073(-)